MNARVRYLIGILGALILIFSIWYFRSIVAYIFISGAISILGQPIVRLIKKIKIGKFKIPNALNAAITLVVLWLFIITFFRFFIPLIISEAYELSNVNVTVLYETIEKPIDDFRNALSNTGYFSDAESFESYFTQKLSNILNVSYISDIAANIGSTLGNLLIAFFAISFITFFFLKDSTLFSDGILMFVPDKYMSEAKHVMHSIRHLLTRYLVGIFIEVLLVMSLITFGLWLVGIELNHALICGLFAGIFNVIPYVGPWIGAAFGVIIAFATNIDLVFESQLLPLLGFTVLIYIITQTLDNILFQPLIYSSSVNAHPLEIFLVILMAAGVAGIGGMILAIPAYTIVRVIAKEFFSGFKIVQKLTRNI